MSKLISTFKIRFDDETKAEISELKIKLDEVNKRLNAKDSHGVTGLLKAMQSEAANDVPQPELKQLGQWVFEGQDEMFESASVRQDGFAALWSCKSDKLSPTSADFLPFGKPIIFSEPLGYGFDATNWQNSAINRKTINDVGYLSESVPTIQAMEASEIIDDECDWLSESVPQITQADMQLIFIKNLSECLIQRMHSMNRFSEDDYAIGGAKLMSWDILVYEPLNAYAVLIDSRRKPEISDLLFFWDTGAATDVSWNTKSAAFELLRTITEAELSAFRAALEASYA